MAVIGYVGRDNSIYLKDRPVHSLVIRSASANERVEVVSMGEPLAGTSIPFGPANYGWKLVGIQHVKPSEVYDVSFYSGDTKIITHSKPYGVAYSQQSSGDAILHSISEGDSLSVEFTSDITDFMVSVIPYMQGG